MKTEHLIIRINGLTKYALSNEEAREAFVRDAVGQEVVLREMTFDGAPVVNVFAHISKSDFAHIGNVERLSLALALRALRGEKSRELCARIVKAEQFLLTVELEVGRLADELPHARSLGSWEYTGPVMNVSMGEQTAKFLVSLILSRLQEPVDAESAVGLLEEYSQLTAYDLSRDCLDERSMLADRLEAMADERLRQAAARLREDSQRRGGRHGMQRIGAWMKHELPTTEEAVLMVARSPRSHVRTDVELQAEALPAGLLALWRTDERLFARTIYNMSASRYEIRLVLSCLTWLDATADGAASTDGAAAVAALVDTALEMDDADTTRAFELLLARANDKAAHAYSLELRRLRRWQAEERVRALELPRKLDTPEARALLVRAQERGWLTSDLQPAGDFSSTKKASILASAIAGELGLKPLWEPFESLWHTANLRIAYSQAQTTTYYARLMKKATQIL